MNTVVITPSVKRIKQFCVLLASSAVGLVYSAPAYAQIDEIVVTARKTEENLQDVPISVTALPGDFLKDAGVTAFTELSQVTPNFDVRSDGVRGAFQTNLTIRGQTSTTSDLTIDQAVGININGVPVTRGTNLFSNLFDIEQVEVLRGPQGTLFGKNTTGGNVIVTTTAPKLGETSGYGEFTYGNFDQTDIELVVNIPVGGKAALRVGGALTNRDGFGDGTRSDGTLSGNEVGNDDETFVKASLLIEPSDKVSIRINADNHEVDERGSIVRAQLSAFPIAQSIEDVITDFHQGNDFNNSVVLPHSDRNNTLAEETNVNATVEVDLGFAQLTSVSGYREQESLTDLNYSPLGAIIIAQDSELYTQELRLAGEYNALQWVVGGFFSNEDGFDRNNVIGRAQVTAVENESISVFAQGTYAFNDRFNLTLGGRYTDEDRGVELQELGVLGGAIEDAIVTFGTTTLDDGSVVLNDPANTTIINDASFDDVSWTVALDYQLTDDVLAYGSVSSGFRSGGIDGDNDLANEVDAETVLNYELGFKTDLFDNTVRFNTAFWYSDYQDIQIQSFSLDANVAGTVGVPQNVLNNAAEAELYGFEAEVIWQPTEDFSLNAGAGYTKGDFKEFDEVRPVDAADPALGTFVFDRSEEPVGGPEWQFNFTPRYSFDVTDDVRGNAQFTVSYLDSQELAGPEVEAIIGRDLTVLNSITLVNGQVDFDIGDDLNVAFWAKNLFDEEYFESGFALGVFGGLAQRNAGAPRTYGVRLNKSF